MEIKVLPASKEDLPIIQNLARFYIYEMSKYCGFLKGWEVPENGLFQCIDLSPYWIESEGYPFIVRVNGELAGFVLVNKKVTESQSDWNMGEFYIVSEFQGKGIGKKVAQETFANFPGTWEVTQIPENTAAIDFWNKVIGEMPTRRFEITTETVEKPKPHPMNVMTFTV